MPEGSDGMVDAMINEIVEWACSRPKWEQQALHWIARGHSIGDEEVDRLADIAEHESSCCDIEESDLRHIEINYLSLDDFSGGVDGQKPVRLVSITEPKSVNALTRGECLTFGKEGITVIYGQNGSGKSGYARILKKVTRARHSADVLTDVFAEPAEQSARLKVHYGSDTKNLAWPADQPDFLSRVSFYDSDCAAYYVSNKTEVVYKPGVLDIFYDLAGFSHKVRDRLESQKAALESKLDNLPGLPQSYSQQFIDSISADTTAQDIDSASELTDDAAKQLVALKKRIANLESDDFTQKRTDIEHLQKDLRNLKGHINRTRETLSDSKIEEIKIAQSEAMAAREAADAASAARFSSEPITGVGSSSWRVLWNAARRFSQEKAYPKYHFPVLEIDDEPGRCVLCHQKLSDHASARLRSFDEYVADNSEQTARDTLIAFEQLVETLYNHEVMNTEIELALQRIKGAREEAYIELRLELESLKDRHARLPRALDQEFEVEQLSPLNDFRATQSLTEELEQQFTDMTVDTWQAQLDKLYHQKDEIEGRQAIRDSRAAIDNHISKLKKINSLKKAIALTHTSGITRKATTLTRTHVSDTLKQQFKQECSLFDLDKVRLADVGGARGNLEHKTQLVGAVQKVSPGNVLSEGEQTALSLAGFLTEVESDLTSSAVVFDDPVTSLDHVYQERLARRIVKLSTHRQVIIFTHDVAFVLDIKRAAQTVSAKLEERWIDKHESHIGRVCEGSPWDSKTVGQRIDKLERELAKVRKISFQEAPEAYQKAVRSWYSDLRTVWERALEEVVIGPVLVRGQLEFRPSNTKIFVSFTDKDHQEFQRAFTRCGERGSHDRSSRLNRPRILISELKRDLESLRTWHKRIKRYMKR